jgi:hypothetical protein
MGEILHDVQELFRLFYLQFVPYLMDFGWIQRKEQEI